MRISEIMSELAALKTTVADFISGKVAATAEQFTSLRTKIEHVEASVNTDLAQKDSDLATARQTIGTLESAKTDLATKLQTAQEQVNALGAKLAEINTALDEAVATFKLDVKSDAPGKEKITALKGTVTKVLATHGIDASALPSAAPSVKPPTVTKGKEARLASYRAQIQKGRNQPV